MTASAVPQLDFDYLEEALLAIASSSEEVARAVISSSSTTFLAHNRAEGYSPIDFHRPRNSRMQELSALLSVYCDLEKSEPFYAGLYRDMIRLMSPGTELVFTEDGVTFPGAPPRRDSERAPPSIQSHRDFGSSVLVTFGDSFTAGEEIDSHELGHIDDAYRMARAYPALLARELGIPEVINRGEPGASNPKIMRSVCDFVTAHQRDLTPFFFVISFTHPARKAFIMKNGGDGRFISWSTGMNPKILRALCTRTFFAIEDAGRADASVNRELAHKIAMVSAFMRRMGCRFVVFPAWNFAASHLYFRGVSLGREAALFLGQGNAFGMKDLVSHLPMGAGGHPLSEGHAYFARELASFIKERSLG